MKTKISKNKINKSKNKKRKTKKSNKKSKLLKPKKANFLYNFFQKKTDPMRPVTIAPHKFITELTKNALNYLMLNYKNIGRVVDIDIINDSNETETKKVFIPTGVWIMGSPLLWEQGYKGQDCIVGVIDTGIDPKHPDLQNVTKRKTYVGDEDYKDLHYHGTHVAGAIAGNGLIQGVAPGATLHDYRIFDGEGDTPEGALEKAIRQGVDDGCHILNLSLGEPFGRKSVKSAITYAKEKGVLIVVASGNESDEKEWEQTVLSYPANYPSVISVAAVDYNTELGEVTISDTKFSNRNPEVDVCAQGNEVASTFPLDFGDYGILSGTSMSCAYVSGFAALMYSKAKYVTDRTGYEVNNLYTLVKSQTVPIPVKYNENGDKRFDFITGVGFVTAYPQIPSVSSEDEYELKDLNKYAPNPDKKVIF